MTRIGKPELLKASGLAALLFLPLSFAGLSLINGSIEGAFARHLGQFLALPLVLFDTMRSNEIPEHEPSTAVLWAFFVLAHYLWYLALCLGALALFRGRRSNPTF